MNKNNSQKLLKENAEIFNKNSLVIENSEIISNSIKKILDSYNTETESLQGAYRKESKFISENFDQVIGFIYSYMITVLQID